MKDVPEDIKVVLADAVKQAVQDPDMIKQLSDIYTTTDFKEGEEYLNYLTEMQNTAREIWGA